MAYTPTLWAKGDKVTSEKLNKIEQGIVDKVDKETGKTLSTNDFTDAYKTKLDGIEANADKTTIDATLTNSGDAADAKATGDAIKDIENDLDGKVAIIESNLDEKVENLRSLVGTPLKATTASDMTDTSKIYVYTGNESGYTNGDWYYHDGSAWVDGGIYNSVAVEVDDTLTVNGMPADAKVVGDEIGSIKEDLQDKADKEELDILVNGYSGGENLFNPDDATDGQALIANGSTTTSANKFVSEYMPVLSDYEYKYRGGTPNMVFIASYDSNKTFIDGSFVTRVSEYTTPVNAKYVRITDYLIYKSVAQFYAVSTDGMRETIDNLESALDIGAISDGSPLETSATYNALIMGTGEISSTSNTLFVLRKYAVEKGRVYAIKGTQVSVRYDAYGLASFSESNYTGSKINSDLIIYGTGGTATNYYVAFTAPTNGYIYLLLYDINKPKLELYDAVLLSKLMYKLTNSNKDVVKIQAFGDSITDDSWRTDKTTWLTLLPDYLTQRTLSIKNEGVGGSHIGHGRVNSDTGKYHDLEYNYVYDLMTNADIFDPTSDIIVMFVGTNDFNSSPLGQWGDSTVDTFYGAAKMVCEYISQNTSALFLVVTPIARPDDADSSKQLNADGERVNGYGATLRDYAEALIKTCDFYQFPVIDLFHDIGWNKTNVRAWLDATGIHPSVKGSNAICAYISSEIKKHFGI